jgi:hypothetical protein
MAFNVPINSIAPLPTPSDWVRPSDWITITDTPNEVQFLVCDLGAKAFTITTTFTRTTGNIYIDWGDGIIDTISTTTSTDTSHVYSTGGTPCSRGYNTFKIRIYGDATCVITNARHIPNFAQTGGNPYYCIGLLEVYFGNGTCNTSSFNANYFTSNTATLGFGTFSLLEYVKLPSTVSWTTQMASMFQYCNNLYKVIMPTSGNALTTLNTTFQYCNNLLDIILPTDATTITTLANSFQGCSNLRTILFPTNLNNCTTLASCFNLCISIKNITLPSINLCIDLSSAFNSCQSLQWVKFTSLPSPIAALTVVNISGCFQNSQNLQNVYFPTSCSINALYNVNTTFTSCYSLKNILFPINFNPSAMGTTFASCYSLTRVIFQSTAPNLTSLSNCFQGCPLLNSITLPTTVGSSINLSSTFQGCIALSSITIPSGWIISTLNNTFNSCFNLTSIILPNNAQDSCGGMNSMCNNCYKLQSITMPTSLNTCTSIQFAFFNCYRLTSIVFPATMNSITTMGSAFTNCYSLTSVTMPTSMTSCNDYSSTFQGCWTITSITMPSTVSVSAGFGSTFSNCYSLKTITLPTNQLSSCNSIGYAFNSSGNLTTINNLNKIGSLTATPLVNGDNVVSVAMYSNKLTSLSFSCPFSVLRLNGSSTTQNFNKLNSLRLLNASAGQYTGASPQINVSYCDLGITALNQLFTDLPTVVGKTINITGCTGAAGCTRTIATAKGWTVTG